MSEIPLKISLSCGSNTTFSIGQFEFEVTIGLIYVKCSWYIRLPWKRHTRWNVMCPDILLILIQSDKIKDSVGKGCAFVHGCGFNPRFWNFIFSVLFSYLTVLHPAAWFVTRWISYILTVYLYFEIIITKKCFFYFAGKKIINSPE